MDSTELRDDAAVDRVEPKPVLAAGGKGAGRGGRRNPFSRAGRFYREVWAELRKVLWPTRRELIGYTAVVVTFVTVMVLIVAGLDFSFTKAILAVFG